MMQQYPNYTNSKELNPPRPIDNYLISILRRQNNLKTTLIRQDCKRELYSNSSDNCQSSKLLKGNGDACCKKALLLNSEYKHFEKRSVTLERLASNSSNKTSTYIPTETTRLREISYRKNRNNNSDDNENGHTSEVKENNVTENLNKITPITKPESKLNTTANQTLTPKITSKVTKISSQSDSQIVRGINGSVNYNSGTKQKYQSPRNYENPRNNSRRPKLSRVSCYRNQDRQPPESLRHYSHRQSYYRRHQYYHHIQLDNDTDSNSSGGFTTVENNCSFRVLPKKSKSCTVECDVLSPNYTPPSPRRYLELLDDIDIYPAGQFINSAATSEYSLGFLFNSSDEDEAENDNSIDDLYDSHLQSGRREDTNLIMCYQDEDDDYVVEMKSSNSSFVVLRQSVKDEGKQASNGVENECEGCSSTNRGNTVDGKKYITIDGEQHIINELEEYEDEKNGACRSPHSVYSSSNVTTVFAVNNSQVTQSVGSDTTLEGNESRGGENISPFEVNVPHRLVKLTGGNYVLVEDKRIRPDQIAQNDMVTPVENTQDLKSNDTSCQGKQVFDTSYKNTEAYKDSNRVNVINDAPLDEETFCGTLEAVTEVILVPSSSEVDVNDSSDTTEEIVTDTKPMIDKGHNKEVFQNEDENLMMYAKPFNEEQLIINPKCLTDELPISSPKFEKDSNSNKGQQKLDSSYGKKMPSECCRDIDSKVEEESASQRSSPDRKRAPFPVEIMEAIHRAVENGDFEDVGSVEVDKNGYLLHAKTHVTDNVQTTNESKCNMVNSENLYHEKAIKKEENDKNDNTRNTDTSYRGDDKYCWDITGGDLGIMKVEQNPDWEIFTPLLNCVQVAQNVRMCAPRIEHNNILVESENKADVLSQSERSVSPTVKQSSLLVNCVLGEIGINNCDEVYGDSKDVQDVEDEINCMASLETHEMNDKDDCLDANTLVDNDIVSTANNLKDGSRSDDLICKVDKTSGDRILNDPKASNTVDEHIKCVDASEREPCNIDADIKAKLHERERLIKEWKPVERQPRTESLLNMILGSDDNSSTKLNSDSGADRPKSSQRTFKRQRIKSGKKIRRRSALAKPEQVQRPKSRAKFLSLLLNMIGDEKDEKDDVDETSPNDAEEMPSKKHSDSDVSVQEVKFPRGVDSIDPESLIERNWWANAMKDDMEIRIARQMRRKKFHKLKSSVVRTSPTVGTQGPSSNKPSVGKRGSRKSTGTEGRKNKIHESFSRRRASYRLMEEHDRPGVSYTYGHEDEEDSYNCDNAKLAFTTMGDDYLTLKEYYSQKATTICSKSAQNTHDGDRKGEEGENAPDAKIGLNEEKQPGRESPQKTEKRNRRSSGVRISKTRFKAPSVMETERLKNLTVEDTSKLKRNPAMWNYPSVEYYCQFNRPLRGGSLDSLIKPFAGKGGIFATPSLIEDVTSASHAVQKRSMYTDLLQVNAQREIQNQPYADGKYVDALSRRQKEIEASEKTRQQIIRLRLSEAAMRKKMRNNENQWNSTVNEMLLMSEKVKCQNPTAIPNYSDNRFPRSDSARVVDVVPKKTFNFLNQLLEQDQQDQQDIDGLEEHVREVIHDSPKLSILIEPHPPKPREVTFAGETSCNEAGGSSQNNQNSSTPTTSAHYAQPRVSHRHRSHVANYEFQHPLANRDGPRAPVSSYAMKQVPSRVGHRHGGMDGIAPRPPIRIPSAHSEGSASRPFRYTRPALFPEEVQKITAPRYPWRYSKNQGRPGSGKENSALNQYADVFGYYHPPCLRDRADTSIVQLFQN